MCIRDSHSDESDIGGIYITFPEKIFRPKYIDVVQSVQSYRVYRYVATSAKHFSVAHTAVDNVVNATLILAGRSETILSRRT